MKKFLFWAAFFILFPVVLTSCEEENKGDKEEAKNYWEEYAKWRKENLAFFDEKSIETDSTGALVYEQVTPSWDAGSTILMRWYNDRTLTQHNPQPKSTSYIDVIYKGTTYEGEVFDDSFELTAHGDSIYRSKLSDNVKGWVIAFTNMHVGDHCEIIIPHTCGYGDSYRSDLLLPYSTLVFDVKLRGIPGLEKPVNAPLKE